jgi:hypothetical protein
MQNAWMCHRVIASWINLPFENVSKGMRDEPWTLEKDGGRDTMIHAKPDRERPFSRHEFCTNENTRQPSGTIHPYTQWKRRQQLPGREKQSNDIKHVARTSVEYSCVSR